MDRVPNSLSVRENQPLGVRKGDESRTKFARALPTGRSSDANRGIAQPGARSVHDPTGAVRDFGSPVAAAKLQTGLGSPARFA